MNLHEQIKQLEYQHDELKELLGHIIGTLLLDENKEHIPPALYNFALQWRKRFHRILKQEEPFG